MNMLCVLDEIPVGVCLVTRERKIIHINRALEALTGFSRTESKGLACSHVLRFSKCLETCPIAKMDEKEKFVQDGDIVNQDHKKIPVRVSFAPLRNSRGKVYGFMETVVDLRQTSSSDPAGITPFSFGRIVGRSEQMERIFQFLPAIAQSDAPVLITGQTGTGKDLLADAVHLASPRAKNPFVTFRCGGLPDYLVESELFGVVKGAFPGAENKPGKFRLAQNGTLYLSEVGELPDALQLKLLNYLDEKTIYPLGSGKSLLADVRVIAASSRNLEQMTNEGRFRKELYFRLNAVSIHLPPLKERSEDLRLLMDYFLRARALLLDKPVTGFTEECLRTLDEYSYPGNILELRHIVEYSVSLCQGEKIGLKDLPSYLTESIPDQIAKPGAVSQAPGNESSHEGVDWSTVERKMIVDALLKAKGRRFKAAQLLGWGRSTLWRKMKLYGITSSEETQADIRK
ncbi:MAG: sigma 54-interacting transcriptional regulator [Desulfobacteraceae bacterium]|nr:sigma 54-interacting transcriptional regulator [Desulfobacteraceae bacterium]